jgi:hypothetical protein
MKSKYLIFLFFSIASLNAHCQEIRTTLSESKEASVLVFESVPIHFFGPHAIVKAEVEGIPIDLYVDTGNYSNLTLQPKCIAKLNQVKWRINSRHLYNVAGTIFKMRNFELPALKIGSFVFENIICEEHVDWSLSIVEETDTLDDLSNGTIKYVNPKFDGILGVGLFNDFSLLLNYPNEEIILIKSSAQSFLSTLNYKDFALVNSSFNEEGIVLHFKINDKLCDFVLDTGSTASILKPSTLDQLHEDLYTTSENINSEIVTKNSFSMNLSNLYVTEY